jgi:cell division protein FtsW (lipid II flippase)
VLPARTGLGEATIGSGPQADLRLTEDDVPEHLGTITLGQTLRYQHDTTAASAAFWRLSEGALASAEGRPDALVPLIGETRVVWAEGALKSEDLASACAGQPGAGVSTALVRTADATGAWIRDAHGDPRSIEVPAVAGAEKRVGDAVLRWDGAALWLDPDAAEPLRVGAPWLATAAVASAGEDSPVLALGGNRFVKPDVYVQIDDGKPVPIGVTGDSPPVAGAFHVFRRRPRAESSVPAVWAVARALDTITGPDPAVLPRIGRAPGFGGRLWACQDAPVEIGGADLARGDVLLAGHTSYEVGRDGSGALSLSVTEPVSHRVHALASLSTGRLSAPNARIEVPDCAEGAVLVRGETGTELLPEGVTASAGPSPAPGREVATLPLPAWAARAHPEVQERGRLAADVAELCADGDELRITDLSPPDSGIVSGHTIGGHVLRFSRQAPWLEQALPLAGFVPLVALLGAMAAGRLAASAGPRAGALQRHVPPIAVSAFVALLVAGALLQTRLAASDALLGSADYLHRHLLTGVLAAVALLAGADVALRADEGLQQRVIRAVKVLRLGAGLVIGWLILDRIAWNALGEPGHVTAPVQGDLNRTLLFALAGFAALSAAPALIRRIPTYARPAAEPAAPPQGAGLLRGLLATPAAASQPLLVGVLLLAGGVLLGGSGRMFGGFDLKLAEMAPLPVGIGLAALLVGWSRTGSSYGRWAVPFGTLVWVGGVTAAVVVFYALRGDLGPLMVLVPAMIGTVATWTLPWNAASGADLRDRALVLGAYVGLYVAAFAAVYAAVPLVEAHLSELPSVGGHVQRALDRLATHGSTWYTQGGHWTTTAAWIAAGFYGGEHFVSNLHSDLAFVAAMQTFGVLRAVGLLALFGALIALLAALGESGLSRVENAWESARAALSDREARRRYAKDTVPVLIDAATSSYFLVFAALYAAAEILVHVGTCFDTLPQTGLTLPWVSSGGSASVGFALLLGVALARAVVADARVRGVDAARPTA